LSAIAAPRPAARGRRPRWALHLALVPLAATALAAYLGAVIWSIHISLTASRTFPSGEFVGFANYRRLFENERWQVSLDHLALFGVLFIAACLITGFLLAVFIDQNVRGEAVLRTVFLYPYAMSFVVTGLIWQWMLNPELGIQETVHRLGFANFKLDWIVSQDRVMYAIVLAAVWQASGLVMAIMLAGLRGVDEEILKAARLDGIPRWRVYFSIVLPMIGPSVATAFVLLTVTVVKLYETVVAMTNGGPGIASEVPAKFIIDYLFTRLNIGLASAASTVLLVTVLLVVTPWLYVRHVRTLRAQAG
jgi:glucose/mannose transport system permease protein